MSVKLQETAVESRESKLHSFLQTHPEGITKDMLLQTFGTSEGYGLLSQLYQFWQFGFVKQVDGRWYHADNLTVPPELPITTPIPMSKQSLSWLRPSQAFTLVEILITVCILGVLSAIAIPNMVKAREDSREQSIIVNCRKIDDAKQFWANQTKAEADAAPQESDLAPYFAGGLFPDPISDETYAINTVAAPTVATWKAATYNWQGKIGAP